MIREFENPLRVYSTVTGFRVAQPLNSHLRIEAGVSLVVVVAVVTALGYMGMAEGIVVFQFGTKHKQELLSYLLSKSY